MRVRSRSAQQAEDTPCDFLSWDSTHFGFPIARVTADRFDDECAKAIDRWCLDNGIRCLYFLADSDDSDSGRVAARHGYRVVDVRLTLQHGLEALDGPARQDSTEVGIREATDADLPMLRALATRSHRSTRFYFDGTFPHDRCDELYATWVERGVRDPDQTVLVIDSPKGAAGYEVICHPGPDGIARLDLIAVAEDHQRRGVGRALLLRSLGWVAERGGKGAITVVQGRNVASIRAHEEVGFEVRHAQIWYHKWYPQHGSPDVVQLSARRGSRLD